MSVFTPLFQIDCPGVLPVLLSWDERRNEFSAINTSASFKASGDIDAITPRLKAYFRFGDLDRLQATALEGAANLSIDPALRRIGEIAAHNDGPELHIYDAILTTLPAGRARRIYADVAAKDDARISDALARNASLFDIAVQGSTGLHIKRIMPTADADRFVLVDETPGRKATLNSACLASRESLLGELSMLAADSAWFGPHPGPFGNGAELLIGSLANHPILSVKLDEALRRSHESHPKLESRVAEASRLFRESVIADPDPRTREAAYERIMVPHLTALTIERSGPANPNQDGPGFVSVTRRENPKGEITTEIREEWRTANAVLRTRVVEHEASDLSHQTVEGNYDAAQRLHSFAGQPAKIVDHQVHDGGIEDRKIERQWHENGFLLATQSIATHRGEVDTTHNEEWTDAKGRRLEGGLAAITGAAPKSANKAVRPAPREDAQERA